MRKVRTKRRHKMIRIKISSAAKMLGITMYEVNANARHFGITPTEIVTKVMRGRGMIR